ncbi:MAG: HAD-IIB family hydrolase [Clostridia bacterium]|nr:HAD-IIB family hydrolase [Clostridia bacterium]
MKIIATDFDGTLSYNGKISDEDKSAIHRFREAGNKFGIVTGRDVDLAQWIKPENGLEYDYLICCTGAVIKNGEGEIIYQKKGKIDNYIYEMIDKARELGAYGFSASDVLLKCIVDIKGKIPMQMDALKEFTQVNTGFTNEENAQKFVDYVNATYNDKISAFRNGTSIDMPPANTSKVTGIYEYAKMFDNPEIYAVGDNINDLSMIEEFCGFAVSNAKEEVKKAANHQCNRIADMIDFIMSNEGETK